MVTALSWAQNPKVSCGQLIISKPNYLDPWDSGRFSVRTETGESIKANWTLVKENYRTKKVDVETIRQQESVTPYFWDSNDSGILTAIATAVTSTGCDITAAVHAIVVERPGSPLIIDEYGKMSPDDERGRLDAAVAEMNKRPTQNLLAYLFFRQSDTGATRRLKMTRVVDHIVRIRKFDPKKLIFLISTSDRSCVKLQAASQVETEVVTSMFPELLVVRADRLDDYKKLFR